MKLARVVHCKKEAYDVLIDRTSVWGNPFVIGKDGDRQAVCRKYSRWFPLQEKLLARLPELVGQTLGCHCHPLECHGDFLAELVNKTYFICHECGGIHKGPWRDGKVLAEILDGRPMEEMKFVCVG